MGSFLWFKSSTLLNKESHSIYYYTFVGFGFNFNSYVRVVCYYWQLLLTMSRIRFFPKGAPIPITRLGNDLYLIQQYKFATTQSSYTSPKFWMIAVLIFVDFWISFQFNGSHCVELRCVSRIRLFLKGCANNSYQQIEWWALCFIQQYKSTVSRNESW